jgi:hypothetical protein
VLPFFDGAAAAAARTRFVDVDAPSLSFRVFPHGDLDTAPRSHTCV